MGARRTSAARPGEHHSSHVTVAVLLILAVVATAACDSRSRDHQVDPTNSWQRSTPSATTRSAMNGSSPISMSAGHTATPTSSTTSSRTAPSGTAPTVQVYTGFVAYWDSSLRDPNGVDPARLSTMLAGRVQASYAQALATARSRHIVWRGVLPTPRVRVASQTGSLVTLTDCPANEGIARPYYQQTGKPAPYTPPTVPPPNKQTISVVHLTVGWRINAITTDTRHTCSP